MVLLQCALEEGGLQSVHHSEEELPVDVVTVYVIFVGQIVLQHWVVEGLMEHRLDSDGFQLRKLDRVCFVLLECLLPLGQ